MAVIALELACFFQCSVWKKPKKAEEDPKIMLERQPRKC